MGTDSLGMWEATRRLPEQMREALARLDGLKRLPAREHVEHVVVIGMGGSGIAGDVALAAAAPFMAVPVTVVRGYELPSYVGEHSLVVAVSFSGSTEETLEVTQRALAHGARCVAIATGGELLAMVEDHGGCVVAIDPGIPQPRAAFGALSVSVLGVLDQVGLFKGATGWANLAIARLEERRAELEEGSSEARAIAERLVGTVPLVVSSGALGQVAAVRWRNQINENAKAFAIASNYPEACHNELAGFEANPELLARAVSLVVLRHEHEHPQISRRYEFLLDRIAPQLASVSVVEGGGTGELATLFDLAYVGDYVSLHLADLLGVDPGPIPVLDAMKRFVAGPRA